VPRLWDIAAAIPAALTELLEAAGLEPGPFDVPLHLGPGMPPQAHWVRSGLASDSGSDSDSDADADADADAGINDTAIA
jgi:hypothetical protein